VAVDHRLRRRACLQFAPGNNADFIAEYLFLAPGEVDNLLTLIWTAGQFSYPLDPASDLRLWRFLASRRFRNRSKKISHK
jgi:hypothetical protein